MPEVMSLFKDISELTPDKNNTRIHDKKNLDAIRTSLQEVGAGRSIVIDEKGLTLAGNGTLEVAKELGLDIQVVKGNRNTLIVVQRDDLTEEEKIRLNLWDNKANDLSRNDKEALRRIASKNPKQRILKGIFSEKDEKRILSAQSLEQPLAPGGAPETVVVEKRIEQESNIKMIQIMLTTDNHAEFVRKARTVGVKIFNQRNINDIMISIVDRAYAEWVGTETDENNSATATA